MTMADVSNIFQGFFDKLKEEVAKSIDAKGLTASGETKNSLRVEVGENYGVLWGAQYIEALESGRKPSGTGPHPNPKTLREPIYDWLAFKKYGISYDSEKERISLSYAISRKIHREGSYLYRTGKKTGVLTEVVNRQKINSLKEQLSQFYMFNVTSQLRKSVKDALRDNNTQ